MNTYNEYEFKKCERQLHKFEVGIKAITNSITRKELGEEEIELAQELINDLTIRARHAERDMAFWR